MSRNMVRMRAPREPIPDWWADEFLKRQDGLRKRICDHIRRADRPLTIAQLKSMLSGTWAVEVHHALDVLTREGVLKTFEGQGQGLSLNAQKTYTYYDLAS